MKKLLPLLAIAALFGLFSCDNSGKSNQGGTRTNGNEVAITINAGLSTDLLVRGAGDGKAEEIDRYTLLVYADGVTEPFIKKVNTKAQGGSFTLYLTRGLNYTIAVWADCSTGPYTIADNGTVSVDPTAFRVNDEKFDAFFGNLSITNVQADETKTMTLTRPFAQLNIKATDYEPAVNKPNNIAVNLSGVYTKFNVVTGGVSEPKDVQCSAAVSGEKLSFAYLFAPVEDTYSINVSARISFPAVQNQCEMAMTAVPARRNYRTDIEGDMLTNNAGLQIIIDPEFDGGEIIYYAPYVAPIAAANWYSDRSEPTDWTILNSEISFYTSETFSGHFLRYFGKKNDIVMPETQQFIVETGLKVDGTQSVDTFKSIWLDIYDDKGQSIDWCILGYSNVTNSWRVWEATTGEWINAGNAATSGFHNVAIKFNQGSFSFYIDNNKIYTYSIGINKVRINSLIFNSESFPSSYLTVWKVPVVKYF